MPTFRVEFEVKADVVLPAGVSDLRLTIGPDASITIRNGPEDQHGLASGLLVIVVAEAESIDSAANELRSLLAEQLDVLAFATHSRFRIVEPKRLIEWDAGKKEREARIFLTQDARYPPDPELQQEYIDSVQALNSAPPPGYTRAALKYFRYGLLDEQPEDQFMRFWLALEIVAENIKEKKKVPIACSKCSAPLTCQPCGTTPTKVPMAKQAIEGLIASIAGEHAPTVSKRQFKARNGLMHGGSLESVEAKCKMPMPKLVNELGTITWHAIMSTFPPVAGTLQLAHRGGEFGNISMVAAAKLFFEHKGDGPHPADQNIPSGKIEILTRFGNEADVAEPSDC